MPSWRKRPPFARSDIPRSCSPVLRTEADPSALPRSSTSTKRTISPSSRLRIVSAEHSHVFVSWTRFHDKSSDIWLARSANDGRTFAACRALYTSKSDNFGSLPVAGPQRSRVRVLVVISRQTAQFDQSGTHSHAILERRRQTLFCRPECSRHVLDYSTDDGAGLAPQPHGSDRRG